MMFKVEYISGNRAWCYCPYHDDITRPNLSITLTKDYYGKWKCWACGKTGKVSKKQMESLHLKEHEPYKYDSQKFTPLWGRLVADYVKNLNRLPLIKTALVNELNISKGLFESWNIGYDGQAYTIPMYNQYEDTIGVQRRFPNSKKCCVTGSKLGIFRSSDMYINSDDVLFICEGFSDTITVEDLGFQVIGRPHCHYIQGIINYLYYMNDGNEHFFNNIIIVPDNDKVGIEGANKLYDEIKNDVETESLQMFKFDDAKDIREYIKLKGKEQVRKELLSYV